MNKTEALDKYRTEFVYYYHPAKHHRNCKRIERFLDFTSKENIEEITLEDIQGFIPYLRENGFGDYERHWHLKALKSFFDEFFVKIKYIKESPVPMKMFGIEETRKDLLTTDKLSKLREAAKDNVRDSAIIELLYDTGTKPSELVVLKIEDLNLKECRILVRGEGLRKRYVFFGPTCRDKIAEYLKSRNDTSPYLFVTTSCKPFVPKSTSILWNIKEYAKAAGIKNINTQIFRRTFEFNLLQANVPLNTIRQLKGAQYVQFPE